MKMGLTGKLALVSAGSRGIGKAIAMGLQREGACVVICARNPEQLERARQEIESVNGRSVVALTADLSQAEQISTLVDSIEEQCGCIHILVNNAGGPPGGRHDEMTEEQWQQAFELTLQSAVRLTNRILPGMKEQGWGRVINISSFAVKQPLDNMLLSNSIRLAALGWAKTLANEVASHGILVNTVCPGWTATNRVSQLLSARAEAMGTVMENLVQGISQQIPMGRMGEPEEIANLAVFLASEAASYMTGTVIPVDGGITQSF